MDNSDKLLGHPGAHLLVDKIDMKRVMREGKRDTQFSCEIRETFLNEVTPEIHPGG